jgi:hypothetical protein
VAVSEPSRPGADPGCGLALVTYHARVGVRERRDQFTRLLRSAIADLLDQRSPFGRLALAQVMNSGADTMFAVSLAGSLFFSISPTAAKDKVLLYLLLTMAPFAVVAPLLGPLIDRSRGARRGMVMASAFGRALLCPFLAVDVHSLLLFPEAFTMLVLSKTFLITKGALVPEMASAGMLDPGARSAGPGRGNAREHGSRAGPDRSAPGRPEDQPTPPSGTPSSPVGPVPPDLASMNARLGLLASLSGFTFALPAIVILKLGGSPSVLWVDLGVYLVAMVAASRLPVPRLHLHPRTGRGNVPSGTSGTSAWSTGGPRGASAAAPGPFAPPGPRVPPGRGALSDADPGERIVGSLGLEDEADLRSLRPLVPDEVLEASMPMSALRAIGGFLTFLVAFELRRAGAATWWFGLLLGAVTAGSLTGVLLVSKIRQFLTEEQILVTALAVVTVVAGFGVLEPARLFEAVVALSIGFVGAVAKPSFDALVQRHVPPANQGRAFARFETRFQLVWVVGSFVPVVLSLPFSLGDATMAGIAAVVASAFLLRKRSERVV